MNAWIKKKKAELSQFYNLGGEVVIIADTIPLIAYEITFPSSRFYTIDLLWVLSAEAITFEYSRCEGTTLTADPSIRGLLSKADSNYHFTLNTTSEIKVLATTVKTCKAIAFLGKITKGRVLMLHQVYFDTKEIPDFDKWFYGQIRQIFSHLNDDLSEIVGSAPDWVNDIKLENQELMSNEIARLSEEKKNIEARIERQEALHLNYSILKSILFTSGKFLEKGIATVMTHLGIQHLVPPGSETDLIISEEDEYIAVEIKGVTGSASLKNSRQLEDWVNKTADQYDQEEVKGLLLLNCYHTLPLDQRVEIIFPPNVVDFSKKRGHCLMTTTSLFHMVKEFDSGKLDKKQILALIRTTEGVLDYPQKTALPKTKRS
ncbi:MAG: hypothetical protein EOO02_21215 [Chitinophagaceae bacterium]|nr:MAG: hypothetical protein EOO02_21215 [Chitinophagaceae bacterium]